jgi:hypothetical protein
MNNVAKALLACLLCVLLHGSAAASQWVQLTPSAGAMPAPREHAASIYDPVGHRMIVVGGTTAAGDVNDVWAFDLDRHTWTEITPPSGPAPAGRFTHNAVYDHAGRRMLVWSGQASGAFLNDVWAFDLDAHTWSQFTPPGPLPNIRYGTAAVFDPIARRLVTFAGFTDQGRFDDTWQFDVAAVAWPNISPAPDPDRRCLHSASYDARDRRMIMYGGQRSGPLGRPRPTIRPATERWSSAATW